MSCIPDRLVKVFRQFDTGTDGDQAPAFTVVSGGHIHDTFQVQIADPGVAYVLQRINQQVFPDVVQLMNNIETVTSHLQGRTTTLCYSRTADQQLYYKDKEGCFWRLCGKIDHEPVDEAHCDPRLATEAGKAFGEFLALLHDLNPALLAETISGFHRLSWRLDQFDKALQNDIKDRAASSQQDTELIMSLRDEMLEIEQLWNSGLLPQRITHNDSKITNILFDRNHKAVCIIDLDTVMPGLVHFDFGDALRTIASTAAEDAADPGSVTLDRELAKALIRAYVGACGALLSQQELETLWRGPGYMTYMMGLRFLTDYLAGDIYYNINYPNHNLVRAKTQFALLRDIGRESSFLRDTIVEATTDVTSEPEHDR